jgi:hypothetical protein
LTQNLASSVKKAPNCSDEVGKHTSVPSRPKAALSEGSVKAELNRGVFVPPISLREMLDLYDLRALVFGFASVRTMNHMAQSHNASAERHVLKSRERLLNNRDNLDHQPGQRCLGAGTCKKKPRQGAVFSCRFGRIRN